MADPLTDGLLVSFDGFSLRLLWGEPEDVKEPADMIDMVSDSESSTDDLFDTRTCPEVGIESRRRCSLQKQGPQRLALLGVQKRRTAGSFPCLNASLSIASLPLQPPVHGPDADLKLLGDLSGRKTLFQHQSNCLTAALLKLISFPKWSHRSPFSKDRETIPPFEKASNNLYRYQ